MGLLGSAFGPSARVVDTAELLFTGSGVIGVGAAGVGP